MRGRISEEVIDMSPFAAMAVKFVSGGVTAALMTLGVTASLADASVSPTPAPASSNAAVASPLAGVRDAVRFAVFEAEADVLRIPPAAFRADLRRGITVRRLALERGLNKEQFGDRLVVNLRPRLAQLVRLHVITRAQADIVIDRIQRGNIPWWDGLNK
jgi:hypothetical protein